MLIRPENRHRYPKDWKQIRERILQRAENKCEFCGVENHTMRLNPRTGKDARIVLTIAHLDHQPENCDPDNLRALCQRCHNGYDAEHRAQTRMKGKTGVKELVAQYKDKFRITKDFSTPFEGVIEPEWWYYLHFGVDVIDIEHPWHIHDWHIVKCSTNYSEIKDIYDRLIN